MAATTLTLTNVYDYSSETLLKEPSFRILPTDPTPDLESTLERTKGLKELLDVIDFKEVAKDGEEDETCTLHNAIKEFSATVGSNTALCSPPNIRLACHQSSAESVCPHLQP